MKRHFEMFAAYNRWANATVYDASAHLSPEEFVRDTGAFFGSAMRTLNHLLVADRIWMKRFTGQGPSPLALNEIQSRDFGELRELRKAEDMRIVKWVNDLHDGDLDANFTYTPMTDPSRTVTQRLAPAVAHFFNHQTHHRGQLHAILTTLGKPSMQLDLIYFQRTDAGRVFA